MRKKCCAITCSAQVRHVVRMYPSDGSLQCHALPATAMDIVVNEALKAYIDPLTTEEYVALERSLLAEGCRDALVLWGDVLVDGHNRYSICQKHGLPFQVRQSTLFRSMEDVHLWMIEQHLGRRSVTDFQRGVLALRKREILAQRRAQPRPSPESCAVSESASAAELPVASVPNREELAKAARLSSTQVGMIEKIQKQAAPELVAAVKSGAISINAAAAVATLPAEEQVEAASGGADQLKQAAKRVREAKRAAREAMAEQMPEAVTVPSIPVEADASVQMLRDRVRLLEAENAALRQQLEALRTA